MVAYTNHNLTGTSYIFICDLDLTTSANTNFCHEYYEEKECDDEDDLRQIRLQLAYEASHRANKLIIRYGRQSFINSGRNNIVTKPIPQMQRHRHSI